MRERTAFRARFVRFNGVTVHPGRRRRAILACDTWGAFPVKVSARRQGMTAAEMRAVSHAAPRPMRCVRVFFVWSSHSRDTSPRTGRVPAITGNAEHGIVRQGDGSADCTRALPPDWGRCMRRNRAHAPSRSRRAYYRRWRLFPGTLVEAMHAARAGLRSGFSRQCGAGGGACKPRASRGRRGPARRSRGPVHDLSNLRDLGWIKPRVARGCRTCSTIRRP